MFYVYSNSIVYIKDKEAFDLFSLAIERLANSA